MVHTEQSAPTHHGTSLGSIQTYTRNIHHSPWNQADLLATSQVWLPYQFGLPVQDIVNNHPHIPWNTNIGPQLWENDTLPSPIGDESNAIQDVSGPVTQDLVSPEYPSLTTQTPSLISFAFPGDSINAAMPVSQQTPQPQAVPTTADTALTCVIACSIPWCPMTFKRKHEQVRHEASVHGINQGIHSCQIVGCPSYGRGFSRKDKLTEHLWKKHGNLGYTKRVL